MPTFRCSRCQISVSQAGSGPPPRWYYVDGISSDRVFACSAPCAAKINEQREASGFPQWRWEYQEGAEPRDTSRLEIAVWLMRAEEEFRAAQEAVRNRDPGAPERYAAARKNLDDAFATSSVILMGQRPGSC